MEKNKIRDLIITWLLTAQYRKINTLVLNGQEINNLVYCKELY